MAKSEKQGYIDRLIGHIAESEEISLEDAAKEFVKRSDHSIDFDNLPKQGHIWVDRGLVMSCEGAPHANHQVFKRQTT